MSIVIWIVLFIVLVLLLFNYITTIAYIFWLIGGFFWLFLNYFCFLGVSDSTIQIAVSLITTLLILFVILKIYNHLWKHN